MPYTPLPEPFMANFLRLVLKPVMGPPFPFAVQRFWMAATAGLSLPPLGIAKRKISLGGVDTYSYAPKGVSATGAPGKPVVLYLHGGAFVTGSHRTHTAIAGYLASDLGSVVHLIEYRLAPEHPYPAGRDDALAAYRALLDIGIAPERIVLVGDSAGGAMVADLLLDLTEAKAPMAAGGAMLSGAFGLDRERPADAGRKDTLVRREWGELSARVYKRSTSIPENSILGRDFTAFPPVYVQYSDDELLAAENRQFVEELRAAGLTPEVHADRGSFHVLALLPGLMKRARQSVRAVAAFSQQAVATAQQRSGEAADARKAG